MDKKLFVKSAMMSAAITTAFLVLISIPSVFAVTPPYYVGPFKGFQYDGSHYIEVAMLGMFDYENPPTAPYPCVLHQGYGYAFSPWQLYGNLYMEYTGWDQSENSLYDGYTYGSPGYCYYYAWPSSPYAYDVGTLAHQYYWNTQTQEIENPSPAAVLVFGP